MVVLVDAPAPGVGANKSAIIDDIYTQNIAKKGDLPSSLKAGEGRGDGEEL